MQLKLRIELIENAMLVLGLVKNFLERVLLDYTSMVNDQSSLQLERLHTSSSRVISSS